MVTLEILLRIKEGQYDGLTVREELERILAVISRQVSGGAHGGPVFDCHQTWIGTFVIFGLEIKNIVTQPNPSARFALADPKRS